MHQIPKSSCKTLIFTAPYWDMAILSYFVEEKWPKIWQNSHISAPEPKIKKIKALCSLQLWKLMRVKCLHFIDFGLWCWDMAILLPCGSNFRISKTGTTFLKKIYIFYGHNWPHFRPIGLNYIYMCHVWKKLGTLGNFRKHVFETYFFKILIFLSVFFDF